MPCELEIQRIVGGGGWIFSLLYLFRPPWSASLLRKELLDPLALDEELAFG